jgi:type I restriction enzyme R subunit
LVKELAAKGALGVLREGFKCVGKTVRLAYFAPNTGLDPASTARYDDNRLTIVRQVNTKSGAIPDVVLAVNGLLGLAIERFKKLGEEDQNLLKGQLVSFRNLYGFVSQIVPYQDSDHKKLYTYARSLLTKLARTTDKRTVQVDEEVQLSTLVGKLNERFGTEFTLADQLFFDQVRETAVTNEQLRQAVMANSMKNFEPVFNKQLENLLIERMDGNEEIFVRLMNDEAFRNVAANHLMRAVYHQVRANDDAA